MYKQLFYVTDCDKSPNLLSRDACYTLGVLKPCYTVEKELGLSRNSTDSTQPQVKPTNTSQVGKSFPHCKDEGSMEKLSNISTKHSVSKEQIQGVPVMKQEILKVYSDVSPELGSFQVNCTSSNLRKM